MKIAVIFNGQGAHYEGMGLDFSNKFQEASNIFDQAEKATEMPIRSYIREESALMSQTRFAQPAMSAVSLAIFNSIKSDLPAIEYMAGLSLGEYSALMASGMISLDEGFRLLQKRGELMSQHCEHLKEEMNVQMLAVIGIPLDEIKTLVGQLSDTYEDLYIANMNSSLQTVLAGSKEAIRAFNKAAKERGYKKGIPLKVEGPFHSPLMQPVGEAFENVLSEVEIRESSIPVISNTTLKHHEPETIKETLVRHLIEPVHWKQTIDLFVDNGVTHIIQIGPGNTLAQLLKREKNVPDYLVVDRVDDVEKISQFLYEGENK